MDHLYISLYFMISNHSVNLKVSQLGRLQNALWYSAVFLTLAWMISWLDYHLNSLSSSVPWMHAHAPTTAHVHLHPREHTLTCRHAHAHALTHLHPHARAHTCPHAHRLPVCPHAFMCAQTPHTWTHARACTHTISYVLFSGLYCICLPLVTI